MVPSARLRIEHQTQKGHVTQAARESISILSSCLAYGPWQPQEMKAGPSCVHLHTALGFWQKGALALVPCFRIHS